MIIIMELINGLTLKDCLLDNNIVASSKIENIMKALGKEIARLHDSGVVHGDLTTCNLIIRNNNHSSSSSSAVETPEIVFIDFGLGLMNPNAEDKAVDLYVLERALFSSYPGAAELVGYISSSSDV
jgi:TP53 regulating kinase-like protein